MIVKYITTPDVYRKHHDSLPYHKVISTSKVFSRNLIEPQKISVVFSLNHDEKRACDRIFGQVGEE